MPNYHDFQARPLLPRFCSKITFDESSHVYHGSVINANEFISFRMTPKPKPRNQTLSSPEHQVQRKLSTSRQIPDAEACHNGVIISTLDVEHYVLDFNVNFPLPHSTLR